MQSQITYKAWIMWALASLFYAYQYVLRVLPNIMMPEIMEKFHIDAGIFGQFSGLYYIGYAGMHIPIGIMLDRFGPRVVMALSIILTIIGLVPLIYTDVWIYPSIGRALIGMGSSGAILGVFKVIRMGFPERHFTRMLGISVTIGLLGAIYGGQPVNYLLTIFGWERVLEVISIVGIMLAALTYISIPKHITQEAQSLNIWQDIKSVLTNSKVLAICLLGGLMVGPLEGFADVWGTEFLKSVYNFEDSIASTLPSFIFFGMCFGAPFLSYIADKTQAYYEVIAISALVMGVGFIMVLTGSLSATMLMIVFSIIGVMCAYQIPVIYKASTQVEEKVVGLTTACANMIIMFFGYFFHSSIGQLMDRFWDGQIINGAPVYNGEAFTYALAVIPVGLAIGGIGFVLLRQFDTKTKLTSLPSSSYQS